MTNSPTRQAPAVPSAREVSRETRASFQEMKKDLSELNHLDSWELSPNESVPLAFTEKGNAQQLNDSLKVLAALR